MSAKRVCRAIAALLLTAQLGHHTAAPALPLQDDTLGTWTEQFNDGGGIKKSGTRSGLPRGHPLVR